MFSEISFSIMSATVAPKPKVACLKCKRDFEAGELLKCGLCPRGVCKGCVVNRYGKKFCSDRCMFYFGLEDEF